MRKYGLPIVILFLSAACVMTFQPSPSPQPPFSTASATTTPMPPTITLTRTLYVMTETLTPTPGGFDYDHYKIVPTLGEVAHNLPRLDGSTSASPLWQAVLCRMFGVPCLWYASESAGVPASPGFTVNPWYAYRQEFTRFLDRRIAISGTHGAYLALIDGNADIILVARAPSASELQAAEAAGVTLDVRPVARDAFVFVTHVQNPVDNLTLAQLRGIYSGAITNWAQVGGRDAEIHPYQREDDSGSQELMHDLVMRGSNMIDAPKMIAYSMLGPFNAIGGRGDDTGDEQGIGYSVYFYAENMVANQNVEYIGVEGVEPTRWTIANGDYPLVAEVYVVIRSQEAPRYAVVLRDWLLSPEGQHAVASSGYVPLK